MQSISRRGFTLVELLVVVSIIALLIAILLPALARSRDSANVAICQSNLSGLGKGQLAYTVDSDLFYTISNEWVWSQSRYPDGSRSSGNEHMDPTVEKNIKQGTLYEYWPLTEAFVCPVAVEKLPRQSWWKNEAFIRSYVQNAEAGPSASQEWINKGWTEEESVDSLNAPADFVIFVEENTYSIAGWNQFHNNGMNDGMFRLQPFDYDQFGSFHNTGSELGTPNGSGYYSPDDPLNSGVCYAVMANGHVEEVNYKGRTTRRYGRNTAKWSRMWCKDDIIVER